MVHIIVEHLLSTSGNRLLYESLWNLAINKSFKPSSHLKADLEQNISLICNDLIKEIKRDDPDRNKFYFSTQIVFGTLMLYRLQVNKLYDQVKHALLIYNSTFYKINWLNQIDSNPSDDELSQVTANRSCKKPKQQKKKETKEQQKKHDFDHNFALIEGALKIAEVPVAKPKKGKKKATTGDDTDPTMATSLNQITIVEKTNVANHTNFTVIGAEADEFGAFDQNFDLSFDHVTAKTNVSLTTDTIVHDQEVPDLVPTIGSPDGLRNTTAVPSFIDPTSNYEILLDIQEIVGSQKKQRKRRSTPNDISHRLEPPVKQSRFDEDVLDQFDEKNTPVDLNEAISLFDNSANETGIASLTDDNRRDIRSTYDVSSIDQMNFIEFALTSEKTPTRPTKPVPKKPSKKKAKLVVDKQTMIKDDTLMGSFEAYKKKCVIESPLDTFELGAFYKKSAAEKLLHTPASRMRLCARQLLPIFQRNLKKCPINLLKRKHEQHNESTPPKRARRENEKKPQVKMTLDDIEEPLVAPAELIPTTADHHIVTEAPFPEFELEHVLTVPFVDLPMIGSIPVYNVELNDFEPLPMVTPLVKSSSAKNKHNRREYGSDLDASLNGYKEGEKWSKQKIMNNLKGFWKNKDDSVTMEKLTSQTNRFIAAGIFFELMVLSKTGAIELVQGSDLKIVNIGAGKYKKIYM